MVWNCSAMHVRSMEDGFLHSLGESASLSSEELSTNLDSITSEFLVKMCRKVAIHLKEMN